MGQERTATLETGSTVLDVVINDESQVEVTGTFGSVALTGASGLVTERTITSDEAFASSMTDMKFTLTGAGPVEITVYPLRVGAISKFNTTA